ncbi:hypothetical protein [Fodinibius salinus]|uniref:hypothetical protein n=1 Tax=Fodinibius salinus TaxID=860790 RepID=UPI001478C0D4|nr:hypothetical protein [Fodinibius salinus]
MAKKETAENKNEGARRCPFCGSQAPLVWVHGHGQCAECGINVQECCQGETCKNTANE